MSDNPVTFLRTRHRENQTWYFVFKIVLTYCEKKNLETKKTFEAKGREFANFLGSLEQIIRTVKCQNTF